MPTLYNLSGLFGGALSCYVDYVLCLFTGVLDLDRCESATYGFNLNIRKINNFGKQQPKIHDSFHTSNLCFVQPV